MIWNLHQDDHIKEDEMDGQGADSKHSRTPLLRINWESEPFAYVENLVNWIFFRQLEVRLLLFIAFTCV
jgi:hypothetical protein